MLQATVTALFAVGFSHNCGLLGPNGFFQGQVNIMHVGCQDHCHVKASVIFIFNIILFVSVYMFMYECYETQA